jgi:alkylhydroperoxidase/carboxymuconolactone decarboxylase family protein YurZ
MLTTQFQDVMISLIAKSHALDQCGSAPKRSTRPPAAASIAELSAEVTALRAGTPDEMKEVSGMARVGSGPKALDTKTKELIALAISVAVGWRPCIAFHA